jgi:hypothetical protein
MMFKRTSVIFLLIISLSTSVLRARADEGMWTFGNPPLKQLKEKYNFEPTKEWFDHVRLSSARFSNGGSGSFVSADGLILTNHHIARPLLAKLSTEQRDLLKTGFYAPTRADELRCPDLEINVLVSMEDVTEKVQAAGRGAADDRTAELQRKAEMARIEKESSEKTSLRSNMVTLYEGGEYWLYRFKKYTDVRMVFAPEAQAADFGGDYDNFTYPRHALDFALLRVYENDRPLKVEHYLRWNTRGPQDNELIFVVGNPGSTDRLRSVTEIEYQKDVMNPLQLRVLKRRRDALLRFSTLGPEQERRASDTISSINNSLKRLEGQQEGLLNPKVMKRKIEEEQELRRQVAEKPDLQAAYGGAWDQLAEGYRKFTPKAKQYYLSNLLLNLNYSRLTAIAARIVQYVAEVQRPNSERLEAYRDSNLESLRFQFLSPAPVYTDLEEVELTARLQDMLEELGPDDPLVKTMLGSHSPAEAARDLVKGTNLGDVAHRKALLEGGVAAVERSTDSLIVMARKIDSTLRELDRFNRENFESVKSSAGEKVAKARFTVYGRSIAPDANFTLRFSYGLVKGYELGTTLVPYKTTFAGLFDRGMSFDNKPPFEVAPRVLARKANVDLSVPLNFVYTADTIGGNSGSPVINRKGEIVGVNFDSNIHRFVSRYVYTEETGRAMAVHSGGMIEALRKIYDAGSLADELEGKK